MPFHTTSDFLLSDPTKLFANNKEVQRFVLNGYHVSLVSIMALCEINVTYCFFIIILHLLFFLKKNKIKVEFLCAIL